MFVSYRALLARPGARPLALACGLAWLSFGGYGLALVLPVRAATGSFAVAGAAVAAFSAGSALLAPVRGRVVDRRGPRALPWFAVVHGAALACVALGCQAAPRGGVLVAASGVAGVSAPPLVATARAAWPRVSGPRLAATGHALNAALGDAGQVLGPALVGVVAGLASPVTALAALVPGVLAAAVLLGAVAPAPAPAAAARRAPRRRGVLAGSAGLRSLVLCELLLGASLGALDVAAPALAGARGAAELGALPLAAFATGSVALSFWSGTGRLRRAAAWRFVAGCHVVAGALLLGVLAPTLLGVTLVLAAAGAGYGLLTVALFELLDGVVAVGRAVEAFTWVTTSAAAGVAAGALAAGGVSSGAPARAVLAVVALPSVAAAFVALLRRSLFGAAPGA